MIENIKKTAIITGASKGIGAAISKKLAVSGFNLVLNCSKETFLEKLEAVKKIFRLHSCLFARSF